MIRSLRYFRGAAEARREPCFEGEGACGAVSVSSNGRRLQFGITKSGRAFI
jgi:hypothetical protein